MPVEFRCTSCDKLLRTPDGTEGKQAKCPQCGKQMEIPAQSAFAPPPREPLFETSSAAAASATDNPYHATYAASESRPTAEPVAIQATQVDMSDLLDQTWTLFKDNLLMCVVGGLVGHLGTQVGSALIGGLTGALVDNSPDLIGFVAVLAGGIAGVGLNTFFYLGMAKYFIGIARNGQAEFADLFSAGPLLVPGTILMVALLAGGIAGLMLFVVPGVLFLLTFYQAPLMMVDRQVGVVDSFRLSAQAMAGNKGTVFLMTVLVMFAGMAFILLTCFLGSILVWPFMTLLIAVTYLGITGQPTAARRPVSMSAERSFYDPGAQPQG